MILMLRMVQLMLYLLFYTVPKNVKLITCKKYPNPPYFHLLFKLITINCYLDSLSLDNFICL